MAKFQARHYKAIALILKHSKPFVYGDDYGIIVDKFVRAFKADNNNFKPNKFRKACQ